MSGALESPLVRSLFSGEVFAAEQLSPGDPEQLLPEERAGQATWVDKRLREFAAGRQCARRALRQLTMPDYALINGPDRCPIWPNGIVGSITHADGFAAAVVARNSDFTSVGLDAERRDRVGADLWERLFVPAELSWLQSLEAAQRSGAAALLFSAKEALYKCQYLVTRRWLDFHDVALRVDGHTEQRGRLAVAEGCRVLELWPEARQMRGRFAVHEGWVVSSFELATLPRTL